MDPLQNVKVPPLCFVCLIIIEQLFINEVDEGILLKWKLQYFSYVRESETGINIKLLLEVSDVDK